MTRLHIEVPATSANLGPGFDTLGLALQVTNRITVDLTPNSPDVVLAEHSGPEAQPLDPRDNLLCAAYRLWGEDSGETLPGARFHVEAHIPIGRGMGASAAAVVAGLSAGAAATSAKQTRDRLLRLAVGMEGHADNAVAALLGGVTAAFCEGDEVHATHVANHLLLGVSLFIPDRPLLTAEARAAIPAEIGVRDAVFNIGRTAFLVSALIWGEWERIGPAMDDCLHQPYRARLLPGLPDMIRCARAAGAYGAALSGAGPTVIALGPPERAEDVTAAMATCATQHNWAGRPLTTGIRHYGVSVRREETGAQAG